MAIRMRRGNYEDFDPGRMLAGEWAVVLSGDPNTATGRAVYHCFVAGQVERVATYVDAVQIIQNSIPETVDQLTASVQAAEALRVLAEDARESAEGSRAQAEARRASDQRANNAAQGANDDAQAANDAAVTQALADIDTATTRATTAAEAAEGVILNAVPTMTPTVKGGAKLGSGLSVTSDTLSVELLSTGDGSSAGPIASLTAEGVASQDTTTGKNLAAPYSTTSNTANGVTWTYLGDGLWKADGTVDGTTTTQRSFKMFDLGVLPAGTYTCTVRLVSGTADKDINARIGSGSSASYYASQPGSGIASCTFTADGETQYWACPQIFGSTTVANAVFSTQCELGSTATSYEPYTGGAPSPSPDYPQEIQVARGRNLFGEPMNGTLGGEPANGFDLIGGAGTSFKAQINPNTTYTIADHSPTTGNRFRIILFADEPTVGMSATTEATQLVLRRDDYTSSRIYTFNSGSYEWVVLTMDSSTYYSDAIAQLELGSAATPYIPYGHVGVTSEWPVASDVANSSIGESGSYGTIGSHHVLTYDATAGDYTFTHTPSGQAMLTRVHAFDADGAWIAQIGYFDSADSGSFDITAPSGTATIRVSIPKHYSCSISRTIPVPLPSRGWVGALPDGTHDTLTLDGAGHAVWGLNVGVIDLGDPAWTYDSAQPTPIFSTSRSSLNMPAYNSNVYSYMYVGEYGFWANAGYDGCLATGGGYLNVSNSNYTDATAFKTAMNGVLAYHELETPTTEDAGYVDYPTIPEGATITCEELDALSVTSFADGSVTTLAQQWADRLTYELGAAVTSLAARVAALEQA